MMISVICVFNDEKALDELLVKSLKKQTTPYELVAIDNSGRRFSSAAAALNQGARSAKGDYLMFVHQDVSLSSGSWLADAEKAMGSLPDAGIAGIAGARDERGIFGNFLSGIPPRHAWSTPISAPFEVQTLDECLVLIPKKMFDVLQFDEKACDGWHLYAVDYCLSCLERGKKAYVLPMEAYHRSDGIGVKKSILTALILRLGLSFTAYPDEYYRALGNVLSKHKGAKKVYTTCGEWDTTYPLALQRSALAGIISYPWNRVRRYIHEKRRAN